MVMLESHLSGRGFGHRPDPGLLEPLARGMVVILALYGLLRLQILARAGALGELLRGSYESLLFGLEFGLGVLLPLALLIHPRGRAHPAGLPAGALLAVLGFVMHRLNVSVTGMERAAGLRYLPSLMEIVVSLGLVALGFALFALAVRYTAVFDDGHAEPRQRGDVKCAAVSAYK
jgi:Ni/Fe-hydrogenase subunit HybB-like protein